eukprot:TRINITY_DN17653_c0_g1_i3.p2 TRINITY_DN17653_c0_g1~~TRINITY_DN17653_c0_g1_i3.p2  ORF type:complete len:117 (+),score=15.16 TRINITY_DN17653_c0_g1_i3:199-549(+)
MMPCGGECLAGNEGDICCLSPMPSVGSSLEAGMREFASRRGILCSATATCCDGVCVANGTACATNKCSEGMVACGGECLLGTAKDMCCLGPTGRGIICGPDAVCCAGICKGKGSHC